MLSWVDGGYPRMMALVVERRRCDGADGIRQRREAGTCLRRLTVPPPSGRLLIRRPFPIGAERNTQLPRSSIVGMYFLASSHQPATQRSAHPKQLPAAGSLRVLHRCTSPKLYSTWKRSATSYAF